MRWVGYLALTASLTGVGYVGAVQVAGFDAPPVQHQPLYATEGYDPQPVAQAILDDLVARYGVPAVLSWDANVDPRDTEHLAQVEMAFLPRQHQVISIRSDYWTAENESFLIETVRHEYAHVLQSNRIMRYSISHLQWQPSVYSDLAEYLSEVYGEEISGYEAQADAFAALEGSRGDDLAYAIKVFGTDRGAVVFPARSHEALQHLIDGSLMP